MLPKDDKQDILQLLKSTNRPNIDSLINYLQKDSDFFTAPASTRYHGSYKGGLAVHSLNVYYELKYLAEYYQIEIPEDTIIIVGLLHDLCKVNTYEQKLVNVPPDKSGTGKWEKMPKYVKNEKCRMGHGSKSVALIQQHIKLTEQEMQAIYWHMGAFDLGNYNTVSNLSEVYHENILAFLLHIADMATTYITENENLNKEE